MKALTERQIQRRERILASARKLLTEKGVDGVTMRTLAQHSGVAPKTLYHQFGSKDQLLRTAVEERFRYYFRMIDEAEVAHGIDRLYHIIDTLAATTRSNLAYARSLLAMTTKLDESADSFNAIRARTVRKAVDQIAAEDGFVADTNPELVTTLLLRQMHPSLLAAQLTSSRWRTMQQLVTLEVSLLLSDITQGYTQKQARATVRSLLKSLKGFRAGPQGNVHA